MDNLHNLYIRLTSLNDSLLGSASNRSATIHDASTWNGFNSTLDEIAKLTSDPYYATLKITPHASSSRQFVLVSDLSTKVYQATNYLFETQKDTYIQDGTQSPRRPQTPEGNSISQTVHQAQDNKQSQRTEVNIEFNQTLQYMTEAIFEAKSKYPEGSKERTFIDKLKDGITAAKTTADLVKMIMSLAVQLGITTEVLGEIFK